MRKNWHKGGNTHQHLKLDDFLLADLWWERPGEIRVRLHDPCTANGLHTKSFYGNSDDAFVYAEAEAKILALTFIRKA